MLKLTIKKELPDDREYQRLLEFCQGLTAQKPNQGLPALRKTITTYVKFMKLRVAKVNILDTANQITFKYKGSADTYFFITKTHKLNDFTN